MEASDVWVDPPSGWNYGFPKIKKADDKRTLEDWLLDNGYPSGLITLNTHNWCRFWGVSDEQSS